MIWRLVSTAGQSDTRCLIIGVPQGHVSKWLIRFVECEDYILSILDLQRSVLQPVDTSTPACLRLHSEVLSNSLNLINLRNVKLNFFFDFIIKHERTTVFSFLNSSSLPSAVPNLRKKVNL